jgi:hypothetical protein
MFNPVEIDETTLIERVDERVKQAIDSGEVAWPQGYSYRWVGQYKEAQKANQRLMLDHPDCAGDDSAAGVPALQAPQHKPVRVRRACRWARPAVR